MEVTENQRSKRRHRSLWRQFLLLLWKSWHLRKRHWFLTFLEIILPVLLFSVLLYLRLRPGSTFIPVFYDSPSPGQFDEETSLRARLCSKYGAWVVSSCVPATNEGIRLFYGPAGNFTKDLAFHVAKEIDVPDNFIHKVNSNEAMNEEVNQLYITLKDLPFLFFLGLFVEGMEDLKRDEVPTDFQYHLRLKGLWNTGKQYLTYQEAGPRTDIKYRTDGFVLLQSIIDRFYISKLTKNNSYVEDFKISLQDYPYPPYYDDNGANLLFGSFIPLFVMLSFILLSPSLIKSIVHEKETGVRELACLMGMNRWLVWIGWFIHSLVPIIVVITIITIILSVGLQREVYIPPILGYTDPYLLWVFLFLYGISAISFCLFVTTFFSRPTLATTFGILIWLLSYFIPNSVMSANYSSYGLAPKLISSLLPNMASSWAFRIIQMFEGRGVELGWHNLWATGTPTDQLSFAMLLLMLVLDIFVFLLLTWYIDQVHPGIYGVPLPWYFPFQKSYWCGHRPKKQDLSGISRDEENQTYFEDEPVGLRPGIVIKNLRKEFKTIGGKIKVAVENVSMTCYEGQCTVLLGHNGAGKTTTMSVLTGVYAPSKGSAHVGGWDIATNLKEAREELGLCPQHNMLFVDLTVIQHLLFFGRLKGLSTSQAKEEAKQILGKLDLLEKRHMFGNQLSGGMKRKLCLAISLVGGSKVVILDEPSSGLDPESRRWVWNVVQGERGNRTFLITTHHMEEADVLGDRVAIMAAGRVVCAGSTLFLKNKFGDGYTLELLVSEDVKSEALQRLVRKQLPAATLHSFQGGEITFKLPPTTTKFAPLLEDISYNKHKLGVKHIGLSLTTMERVFLRVCEVMEESKIQESQPTGFGYSNEGFSCTSVTVNESVENNNLKKNDMIGSSDNRSRNSLTYDHGYPRNNPESRSENNNQESSSWDAGHQEPGALKGWSLGWQRLRAFFIKRVIYTKRKWPLLITQILLPVIVTVLCIIVDGFLLNISTPEHPLTLGQNLYASTISYVSHDSDHVDLAAKYMSLFSGNHQVMNTTNITVSLLNEAKRDLPFYRENNIASAAFFEYKDFSEMQITAQTIPIHTMGVATTLVDNALLRYATNSRNNSITTINYPLPRDTTNDITSDFSLSSIVYSTMMPIALSLLSSSFLVFPLQERVSKAKQVQIMTGAPVWMLWLVSFIWDYLAYLISVVLIFILFVALDPNDYFTPMNAPGVLFLLLFMYGWGSIPMAYVFSFPFQTSASGFSILALINIVAGMILSSVVYALDLANEPKLELTSLILNWIASVVPAYPVSKGFRHIVETSKNNTRCDSFETPSMQNLCQILANIRPNNTFLECCPQCKILPDVECFKKKPYLRFDGSGMSPDILTLLVNGLIFVVILILIENGLGRALRRFWARLRCRWTSVNVDLNKHTRDVDDDVEKETRLIQTIMNERRQGQTAISREAKETTLIAHELTKRYFGASVCAVDGISFRVKRGECLGLLGVNGAGKTTTFSMLTGDEPPTAGDATINGVSLTNDKSKFVQNIGFCPQFDAIIGEFTGIEMLMLLGRLRGIRDSKLKQETKNLITLVDLTECAERPSSTYSGGNKRKLSTAMALVGSPPLVFLDEPTSGVDPASRRRVWKAITQAVSNGQSVVLTSHSMEECEALCSRIIIMSRGTLRCMGTSVHLKAKFGQGYSLQIKLKTHAFTHSSGLYNEDQDYEVKVLELKNLINHHLPGSVINDQHKGMIAYKVPATISWGQLFSVMETLKAGSIPDGRQIGNSYAKTSFSIVEDYAASDTSLEQVFLSFAREDNSVPREAGGTATTDFGYVVKL